MPKAQRAHPYAIRFGEIIRRHRMARGWTIAKFSQRCGMNPTYLGIMEKGGNMPSLESLLELADVFNADPAEWVREIDQMRKGVVTPT